MATYYVSFSYTGNTSNGDINTPWKTLSAINMGGLNPGDSVLFKRGDTFSGTLNPTRSGVSGNYITFSDYSTGNKPKFIGVGSTIPAWCYQDGVNYLKFKNLEIIDPTIDVSESTNPTRIIKSKIERAFYMDGTSHHNVIEYCDITAVGVGAFWVGPSNTMDHCNVGDLTMVVDTNTGPPPGTDDDYGANPVVLASANNIITNNYFFRCWAHSYDYRFDGGAIEFFGNGCSNNYIANNIMFDCIGVCEWTGSSTGNKWYNNVMINNGSLFYFQNPSITNVEFYNNTVIETIPSRYQDFQNNHEFQMFGGNSATTMVIKNNIFWLANGTKVASSGTNKVHENNIHRLSSGSTIGYTADSSELTTTNTLFQSVSGLPNTWNLHPAAGSPAIDFGQSVGIVTDFEGTVIVAPPNAGAYEFPVVVGPTTLVVSATISLPISCNGGVTNVTVSATGGTPPYVGTGSFSRGVGVHSFIVTDATSSVTASITIAQPNIIVANASYSAISTPTGTTTVTASATGGTAGYTYSLDGSGYQSSPVFSNIISGAHVLLVRDSLNCIVSKNFSILLAKLKLLFTKTNTTCKNTATGQIRLQGSGGVAPYTYRKNNGSYTSTFLFTSLPRSLYTMRVKDATGAVVTQYINITPISNTYC